MSSPRRAAKGRAQLSDAYKWITSPLIIGAPMRVIAGPHLALAVSQAGGLGFIGPGARGEDTAIDLETVKKLLSNTSTNRFPIDYKVDETLPVGVGFLIWCGDLDAAVDAVRQHKPCAAWLYGPRHGQAELDEWTSRLREASNRIKIWIQIGTLQECRELVKSRFLPDTIVIQGAESGGHGRSNDGMGLMALFPELADYVRESNISLVAAGGIADGRGIAAALALGAQGVAMGTRFIASTEARINKGYQDEVVRASDAAQSTTRTQLYNHLRGTLNCPEQYSPRGVVNQSWHDHQAGVPFEELKRRHDEAAKSGDKGWGPEGRLATYAGGAIGLVHSVEDAAEIVERLRGEAVTILANLSGKLQ